MAAPCGFRQYQLTKPQHSMHTSIESLEARIAPASVITYTDIDGDKVKITSSKGTLTAANLTLSNGDTGNLLALTLTNSQFAGADITFSVVKKAGGDGRADVGTLNSQGIDLNFVTIKGDLSKVLGGDSNTQSPAFAMLKAHSMGEENLASGMSSVIGRIGSFLVKGNIRGSQIFIHGNDIFNPDPAAKVDLLKIGKSLIGTGAISGNIHAEGGFGDIVIGRDIIGGDGDFSGRIEADGAIGTLRVAGSIIGGAGEFSGTISADGLGTTKIGRDVAAGTGKSSGAVRIDGNIADVRVGRDLKGGPSPESGVIWAKDGNLGSVVIARNVIGGDAAGSASLEKSGAIIANDTIESVRVGGSLISGTDESTGSVRGSGAILAGKHLGILSVGRNVVGNETNPVIVSAVDAEFIPPGGSDFAIDAIKVSGRVAYTNFLAGFDLNGNTDNADASIGPVKVGGSWSFSNLVAGARDAGPTGYGTGDLLQTVSNGMLIAKIARITIGGKMVGSASGTYGFVSQQIDSLKIAGKRIALTEGPSNDGSKPIPSAKNIFVEEVS
jgi:hypothetical protein